MRGAGVRAGLAVLGLLLIGAIAVLAVFTITTVQKNSVLDSRLSSTEQALTGSQNEIALLDDTLRSVGQELAGTNDTVNAQADDLRTTQGELEGTSNELKATKVQVRAASSQLAAAEGTLASTVTELRAAENDARDTEQSLADTQKRLAATDDELASTKQELDATNSDVEATKRELDATNDELASTKQELDATNSDVGDTKRELASTQQELADTAEILGEASSDITALETQLAGASQELGQIRTAIGSVERLREEALGLEVEIVELRERRQPLILDTFANTFRCTGSMEPKVGCTDSALWLRNYDPNDIVEGAFVSFSNAPEGCWTGNTEGSRTAHRVIDIRERNGERQFRTMGDNNRRDDGCWLSSEHINYYAIEFNEDTHPERQWQRDGVSAGINAYRARVDEYEAYLERHCTLNRATDRYRCRDPYYGVAQRIFREVNSLKEVNDCWVDLARNWDWRDSSIPPMQPPCSSN